jgi:hypothetical protein
VDVEYLDLSVGVTDPELDRERTADVDVYGTAGGIGFSVIRSVRRMIPNLHEPGANPLPRLLWQPFDEDDKVLVDEQPE